ncbi:hypothetical protein [Muricomes intestini]|uniref:hypothetical protein n=1 Tax=Muricomes intestini TaxID=1796634 RepID=UPI002FDCBABD
MTKSKKNLRINLLLLFISCICMVTLVCNAADKKGLFIHNRTPYTLKNVTLKSDTAAIATDDIDAFSAAQIDNWSDLANSCILQTTVNGEKLQFPLTNVKISVTQNGSCTITLTVEDDSSVMCRTDAVSD